MRITDEGLEFEEDLVTTSSKTGYISEKLKVESETSINAGKERVVCSKLLYDEKVKISFETEANSRIDKEAHGAKRSQMIIQEKAKTKAEEEKRNEAGREEPSLLEIGEEEIIVADKDEVRIKIGHCYLEE